MLNFGLGELALVSLLALIIIGPERLPEMLRFLGRQYGKLRRSSRELRRAFMVEAERADIEHRAAQLKKRREEARIRLEAQLRKAKEGEDVAISATPGQHVSFDHETHPGENQTQHLPFDHEVHPDEKIKGYVPFDHEVHPNENSKGYVPFDHEVHQDEKAKSNKANESDSSSKQGQKQISTHVVQPVKSSQNHDKVKPTNSTDNVDGSGD